MKAEHVEFRDPSDLPENSYTPDFAAEIDGDLPAPDVVEGVSDEERALAVSTFSDALRYLAENARLIPLAFVGLRALDLVLLFAPEDIAPRKVIGTRFACEPEANATTAKLFSPVWHWLATGDNHLSAFGIRAFALLYLVRPDLLDGMTLEDIGGLDATPRGFRDSRQAVDRIVGSLRDIVGEFQSRAMKSEATRGNCQRAQLARVA